MQELRFAATLAGLVVAVVLGALTLRALLLFLRSAAQSGEAPSRSAGEAWHRQRRVGDEALTVPVSAQTPAVQVRPSPQVRATSQKPRLRASFTSTSVLVLMLIISLGSIGVVNGLWSQNLTLDATVESGDINADWVEIITSDDPGPPNPLTDLCDVFGDPIVLTMEYTGDGDDATSHSQADGKVEVVGDPNDATPVFIRASDKSDPNDTNATVHFSGVVLLNGTFDMDATAAVDTTFVHIFSEDGNTLLQTVEFHTSCSQPLRHGDQFGSVKLVGYVGELTPPPPTTPNCETTIGGVESDAEFGNQVAYVVIKDVRHGYSCDIRAFLRNTGSIPFNIIGINGILDAANDEGLSFEDLNGADPGVCELLDALGNSTTDPVDPGEEAIVHCKVLVDASAEFGWTYYFAIEVCVAQWNESTDFDDCKNPPSGTHEGPDEPVLPVPGPTP